MPIKKMNDFEKRRWLSYHKLGGASYNNRCKIDAPAQSLANSYAHEEARYRKQYELRKLGHLTITEAVENKTGLRRDLVDLSDGEIWEFEVMKTGRGLRHPSNINVIYVEEKDV
jgi:hypothetical protein